MNLFLVLLIFSKIVLTEKDYFRILGVSRSATKDDIKRAYKEKSLKMHPDKAPPAERPRAEKAFSELSNAYEILSDDQKRELYLRGGEEALKHNDGGGGGGFNPFRGGNPFRNPFRQQQQQQHQHHHQQQQQQQQQKSQRHYIDNVVFLQIEEHEVYLGVTLNVTISRRVKCTQCHGTGKGPTTTVECKKCNGTGLAKGARCTKCSGSGKVPYSKCPRCKGGGSVMDKRPVSVYVPPGVSDADELQFADLGDEYVEAGKGIIGKGKLVIRIRVVRSFPEHLQQCLASAFAAASVTKPAASVTQPTSPVAPKSPYPPPPPPPPPPSPTPPFTLASFPQYTRDGSNPLHVHTTLTVSLFKSLTGGVFTLPYYDGRLLTVDRHNRQMHDEELINLRGQGIVLDVQAFAAKNGKHTVAWKHRYGSRTLEQGDVIVKVRVAYPPMHTLTAEKRAALQALIGE